MLITAVFVAETMKIQLILFKIFFGVRCGGEGVSGGVLAHMILFTRLNAAPICSLNLIKKRAQYNLR